MEQMKWEQLLFSAGELLGLRAEWCSGGFPPQQLRQSDNEAAPICAYPQTSGLLLFGRQALVLSLPPTAGNQTPWRQRTAFPSQQALLWIVTLRTALDPLLLGEVCGECERGTWSRGEMEHVQGCRLQRRQCHRPSRDKLWMGQGCVYVKEKGHFKYNWKPNSWF